MGAEGNGNNRWEWEGNWNKTRLNVGQIMEMRMNLWEWEGMGLKKKTFPYTSSTNYDEEQYVLLFWTILLLTATFTISQLSVQYSSTYTYIRTYIHIIFIEHSGRKHIRSAGWRTATLLIATACCKDPTKILMNQVYWLSGGQDSTSSKQREQKQKRLAMQK